MFLEKIKIVTVGDVKSGVSTTTGKPWATRNILLGFEDETGESYLSVAVDSDVWQRLGYAQGDIANLHIRFRTRRFNNGFLANDLRIVSPENQ
ncbi:MAG: DUF3127 domain-containing protein [Bacteroidaceae bacterium]|nr:DUF3127 domain-containing protein [Bacteroidaceae bacterium]